ncbi:P-loop containing nucleoside triphosphate hydrolase protein, partial [Mycena capillaripes]
RRSHGFMLVYAVSSRETFECLDEYRHHIVRVKGSVPPMIVVRNKWDMSENEREVSEAEGAELGARFGCPFVEASAKTSHNVERVFVDLVRQLRRAQGGAPEATWWRRTKKCIIM